MIVPYMLTVSIGQVTTGEHRVFISGQPDLSRVLRVEEANFTSIDDYTYAERGKRQPAPGHAHHCLDWHESVRLHGS